MTKYTQEYYQSFPDQLLSTKILSFADYLKKENFIERNLETDVESFIVEKIYKKPESKLSYYTGGANNKDFQTFVDSHPEVLSVIKDELRQTLTFIAEWANQQDLKIINSQNQEKKISESINEFSMRLFNDHYSDHTKLFFSDFKKIIETIYFYLEDLNIDSEFKKAQLINIVIDDGLEHCAQGTCSRFQDTCRNFENNKKFNLEILIKNLIFELADTTARKRPIAFLGENYLEKLCSDRSLSVEGNEIHAFNALQAYLFNDLQISKFAIRDDFISLFRTANSEIFKSYVKNFKEYFTVNSLIKHITHSFYAQHQINFLDAEVDMSSSSLSSEIIDESLEPFLLGLGSDDQFTKNEILVFENGKIFLKNKSALEITVLERLIDKKWIDFSKDSRLMKRFSNLKHYLTIDKEYTTEINRGIVPNHFDLSWLQEDQIRMQIRDYLKQSKLEDLQSKLANTNFLITNINDLILFIDTLKESTLLTQDYTDTLKWLTRDYDFFELFFLVGDEPLLTTNESESPIAELPAENVDFKLKKLLTLFDESSRKIFFEVFDKNNPPLHSFDIEELTQRIVYSIPKILLEKGIKTFKGNAIPHILLKEGVKLYDEVTFRDAQIFISVNECTFTNGKLSRLIFKDGITGSAFININHQMGTFGKVIVEGPFSGNTIKESFFDLTVKDLTTCQFSDSYSYTNIKAEKKISNCLFSDFAVVLTCNQLYESSFVKGEVKIKADYILSTNFIESSVNIKAKIILNSSFSFLEKSSIYIKDYIKQVTFNHCDELTFTTKDMVSVTFNGGKPKLIRLGYNSPSDLLGNLFHNSLNIVENCEFNDLIILKNNQLSSIYFEKNTLIRQTTFRNLDFQQAFLSGYFEFDQDYEKTNQFYFENSKFSDKSLSEFLEHSSVVKFKNSNLNFFFLEATDLSQVDFQIPDVKSTLLNFRISFKKTQLVNANFRNYPPLFHWDLSEANLRGAQFGEMTLNGVKLIKADLTGCDLSQSLTINTDFTGAKIDAITLNLQQLFQFYQQGHRDFSSLKLKVTENFAFKDLHLQGSKLSAQVFESLVQQGFKDFQGVDLSKVSHEVVQNYINLESYNFIASTLPTLLSHCNSPAKQSRLERKKRSIDNCLFNQEELDEIKNESGKIDSAKLEELLERSTLQKGQQIMDYLTEKSLPLMGEDNPRIQKIYNNFNQINGVHQFFNKLNYGLIGMDAVAGLITGDVNKTFISLGILSSNEMLAKLSKFAAANQQSLWGQAISKLEPLFGQTLTFVTLYNIIEESAAYKKGNKEILGNLIGDSLFVNFNLDSAVANFMANRWMARAQSLKAALKPYISGNAHLISDNILKPAGDEGFNEFAAEELEINAAEDTEINLASKTFQAINAGDEAAIGIEEEIVNGAEEFAAGAEGIAIDAEEVATGVEQIAIDAEQFALGTEEVAAGLEGASVGAGFVGAAVIAGALAEITGGLSFAAFVGTRIYSAAIKVKHINDKLPLTGSEKFCEGINNFIGFNLFGAVDAEIKAELEFQNQLERYLKEFIRGLPAEISHVFIPLLSRGVLLNPSFALWDILNFGCYGNYDYQFSEAECASLQTYLLSYSDYDDVLPTCSCIYEIENNVISLDQFYRTVNWDRDRPIQIQGELVCFPNSTESTAIPGQGYHCEGAMGVRLNDNEYPHALIFVNSGDDVAQGFPNGSNTFVLGGGKKRIEGGEKQDIVILRDNRISEDNDRQWRRNHPLQNQQSKSSYKPISGYIDGNGGINTLYIERFFLKDKILDIDLLRGEMIFAGQDKIFKIFNFQKLISRKLHTDRITARCDTQYINGQAGKDSHSVDVIQIPDLSCDQAMQLKLIMATDTYVKNQANQGHFSYLFHRGKGKTTLDIMSHPQNTSHEFLFNYALSEVQQINFYSAAINQIKLSIHFFKQHFYNLTLTIPSQLAPVFKLNDKTEIHIRKNTTLILHHTQLLTIDEIIKRFNPQTYSLQGLLILQNLANETITLSHPEYLNILENNLQSPNHLVGNGIENIYRITANPQYFKHNGSATSYQIAPNVTVYSLNNNQTHDSLDLITLHKQLKKYLNCTSFIDLQQIQNDLLMQIKCLSNSTLHQMYIILKEAMHWYQKIDVYQKLYPFIIVKNPGDKQSHWKLVPKPFLIPENKTQIVLLANRVEKDSTYILTKKSNNTLKFLYENHDNNNNLLITNYTPELTDDQLFFISVKKFFHDPIWKTISLQGDDFVIHFSEITPDKVTGVLEDLKPALNFLTADYTAQQDKLVDETPAAQQRSSYLADLQEPNYLTSSATKPITWLNSILSYSKKLLATAIRTDIVKSKLSGDSNTNDMRSHRDNFINITTNENPDQSKNFNQSKNISKVNSFQFFQDNIPTPNVNLNESFFLGYVVLSKITNKKTKPMRNYQASDQNPTSFLRREYIDHCDHIVKDSIACFKQKFK